MDVTSLANYHRGEKIWGVNTVHTLIGQAGSVTGWHVEDLNMAGVNYLQEGAKVLGRLSHRDRDVFQLGLA